MKNIEQMIEASVNQNSAMQTMAGFIPLLAIIAIAVFGTMDMIHRLIGKKGKDIRISHDPYKIRN